MSRMSECGQTERRDGQRGIALIAVLGLLAMLVILAVAFARLMRVDRLSASNFTDLVAARNLAYTGLARARDDIQQTVHTNVYPADGIVVVSSGSERNDDFLSVGAREIELSMPKTLHTQLWQRVYRGGGPEWENVIDTFTGEAIGRISYAAVDCSGLLDPNHIGRRDRWVGWDPSEIPLNVNLLPEVQEVNAIPSQLTYFIQYDSLPELLNLGQNGPGPLFKTPSNTRLNNFFFASRFPIGWKDDAGNVRLPVYLDPDAANPAIAAEFADIGFPQADALLRNLQDYIDPDDEPAGTIGIYTEAVPMMNEIVVRQALFARTIGTNILYRNSYQIIVECWYPFWGVTNAASYDVSIRFAAMGGEPALATNQNWATFPLGGNWDRAEFRSITNTIQNLTFLAPASDPPPDLPATYGIALRVQPATGGPPVDEVQPTATAFDDSDLFDKDDWSVDEPAVIANWVAAADDPRLNWDLTNPIQWDEIPFEQWTPNGFNTHSWTLGQGTADDTWEMHVANSRLVVPGELGHLLYDETKPWHTIDLLDLAQAEVLHRFTTHTNTMFKGLVNLNTTNRSVLASAFLDAPVERTPGDPGGFPLNEAEAWNLAGQILSERLMHGPFDNVGNLARMDLAQFRSALGSGMNRGDVEALIRNSSGLLGIRQSYYTIIVEAQAGEDLPPRNGRIDDEEVRATQKLLAVVWRDPYGELPSYVRLFKWVTD